MMAFSTPTQAMLPVQDSFVRSDDDCISSYGMPWLDGRGIDTIYVTRTVLWTDRANVWRLGLISETEYVRNLTFIDIDVLHMDIRGQEWCIQLVPAHGRVMENVRFENIRVNNEANNNLIKLKPEVGTWHPYSMPPPGKIQDVYFKNITFNGSQLGKIVTNGPASDQYVNNVTFENVMKGAEQVTANSPNVSVSGYTSNINFTKLLIRSKISEDKRN
jgi:hypothetical protein